MNKSKRYLLSGVVFTLALAGALTLASTYNIAPWWALVVVGALSYWISLELISLSVTKRGQIGRNYRLLRTAVDENWTDDLLPVQFHPLLNFIPKPSPILDGINGDGFRSVGPRDDFQGTRVYLAGDCTAIDAQLPAKESLGYMLEDQLVGQYGEGVEVVNAGCGHYTSIHSLNRFMIDVQSFDIDTGIFVTGINDVLAFVHTDGAPAPDYSNFYTAPNDADGVTGPLPSRHPWLIKTLPSLRLLSVWASRDQMPDTWDRHVIRIDRNYTSAENIKTCYAKFHTRYVRANVQIFIALCRMRDVRPVLMTNYYDPKDMHEPVRAFYAHGIDLVNEEIRRLAAEENVPLLDMAKDLAAGEGLVENKWHFTAKGNRERVRIIAGYFETHGLSRSSSLSESGPIAVASREGDRAQP